MEATLWAKNRNTKGLLFNQCSLHELDLIEEMDLQARMECCFQGLITSDDSFVEARQIESRKTTRRMVYVMGEQMMWLSEQPERNVNDFHRLTHNKFKKTYFKRNPKIQRRYRSSVTSSISLLEIHSNRFQISMLRNLPKTGRMTPEEESRLMRFKSMTASQFH